MPHIYTESAEAIMDKEIRVLDKGFCRLVDYFGGDARVVAAARVSYGGGTKTTSSDQALINYLMRNKHTSPLEQIILLFHLKLPLFIFAQLVRHRTARLNSLSARYSVMRDEFYIPMIQNVRTQSAVNKQATIDVTDEAKAQEFVEALEDLCKDNYEKYIKFMGDLSDPNDENSPRDGVAREQARMILPQNLYTEIYIQMDYHNLCHMLGLRMDWHAQWEIREYANAMGFCAKQVAPMCWNAFEEYKLYARDFSRTEMVALITVLDDLGSFIGSPGHSAHYSEDTERMLAEAAADAGVPKRSIPEFLNKLKPPMLYDVDGVARNIVEAA